MQGLHNICTTAQPVKKDYKKHLQHINGDWQDNEKVKCKTKPRDIPYEMFLNATRERDRLWWKEGKFREYLKEKYNL